MIVKLLINGESHKVRITPEQGIDKKILEIIAEAKSAKVQVNREKNLGYGLESRKAMSHSVKNREESLYSVSGAERFVNVSSLLTDSI